MTSSLPNIIKKTEGFVLGLFNEKGSSQLLFHDYRRASEIATLIQDIGNFSGYNEFSTETEVAKISSWFLACGKLLNYGAPLESAKEQASAFLLQENYPNELATKVIRCMTKASQADTPTTPEDQLLHDAQLAYWSTSNNMRLAPLMRLEEELILGRKYGILEWEEKHLDMLLKSKFFTPYGQMLFTPILNQNIIDQKKRTDNIALKSKVKKDREHQLLRKYQGIEPKIPQRGAQTFFRAVYQNHIQLSAIADNKANMMTGINTILVSVVISIITYSTIIYDVPRTTMPLAIFLLTALVSLIFSVASASPRVTKKNKKGANIMDARKNIAFFGNFSNMSLEEFEEAMDAMLRNDELVYGNMSRDLYYLGKTLDKKYKLLRLSYHIFLGGFIISVLLFSYIAFS